MQRNQGRYACATCASSARMRSRRQQHTTVYTQPEVLYTDCRAGTSPLITTTGVSQYQAHSLLS